MNTSFDNQGNLAWSQSIPQSPTDEKRRGRRNRGRPGQLSEVGSSLGQSNYSQQLTRLTRLLAASRIGSKNTGPRDVVSPGQKEGIPFPLFPIDGQFPNQGQYPLGCILKNWDDFDPQTLTKSNSFSFALKLGPITNWRRKPGCQREVSIKILSHNWTYFVNMR